MAKVKEKSKQKRKASKRLTPAEWGQCIALYKSGEYTQKELADKFSITPEAVCRRMKKEGGSKARGEDAAFSQDAVQKMVKDKITSDVDKIARRFGETKENSFKYMNGIEQITWGLLNQTYKEKKTMASIKDDLKALETAANVFSKARGEKYLILGAKDGDISFGEDLPELEIVGMSEERVQEIIEQANKSVEIPGLEHLQDIGEEVEVDPADD